MGDPHDCACGESWHPLARFANTWMKSGLRNRDEEPA